MFTLDSKGTSSLGGSAQGSVLGVFRIPAFSVPYGVISRYAIDRLRYVYVMYSFPPFATIAG